MHPLRLGQPSAERSVPLAFRCKPVLALSLLMLMLLVGCGGGGGGGSTATATGRVIFMTTGQAPNPAATVQVGNVTTTTDSEGAFSLNAPAGSTSLLVIYQASQNSTSITFRFDIEPPLSGMQNLGDLYIGPQKVVVTGRIVSSVDSSPVSGAVVRLGGQRAVTDANGVFTFPEFPYDAQNVGAFLGLQGSVTKAGFFDRTFFPDTGANNGVVTLLDITITPTGGVDPPPPPATIFGNVNPASLAPGTVLTLSQNGTPIRQTTVGTDGSYGFLVQAGVYTISGQNPINGRVVQPVQVTLNDPASPVRQDLTLQ